MDSKCEVTWYFTYSTCKHFTVKVHYLVIQVYNISVQGNVLFIWVPCMYFLVCEFVLCLHCMNFQVNQLAFGFFLHIQHLQVNQLVLVNQLHELPSKSIEPLGILHILLKMNWSLGYTACFCLSPTYPIVDMYILYVPSTCNMEMSLLEHKQYQ